MNGQLWTAADLATLRELFPIRQTPVLAQLLGCKVSRVQAMASKLRLKKLPEGNGWLKKGQSQPGTEGGRFRKGIVPANKGLRRPGYSVGRGRMSETTFKPGQRPHTWRPLGTIAVDNDGYVRIKVRERREGEHGWHPRVWPALHRYIYELRTGKRIPKGKFVVFKDRDRTNCVFENLELITRAENANRNRMWNRLPRELAEAIQLNGVLKRRIRRQENGKEQDQRSA